MGSLEGRSTPPSAFLVTFPPFQFHNLCRHHYYAPHLSRLMSVFTEASHCCHAQSNVCSFSLSTLSSPPPFPFLLPPGSYGGYQTDPGLEDRRETWRRVLRFGSPRYKHADRQGKFGLSFSSSAITFPRFSPLFLFFFPSLSFSLTWPSFIFSKLCFLSSHYIARCHTTRH